MDAPFVSITQEGDLSIRLSQHLAKNQPLLTCLNQLGLACQPTHIVKFNKTYTIECQVARIQIKSFLLDLLNIDSAVYQKLISLYEQANIQDHEHMPFQPQVSVVSAESDVKLLQKNP